MRIDPLLLKKIGRAAAFALVGAAILATGVSLHRREPIAAAPVIAPPATDPLGAELGRCREIAKPEDVDDACRAAWAEMRRRFFATDHAGEARP